MGKKKRHVTANTKNKVTGKKKKRIKQIGQPGKDLDDSLNNWGILSLSQICSEKKP